MVTEYKRRKLTKRWQRHDDRTMIPVERSALPHKTTATWVSSIYWAKRTLLLVVTLVMLVIDQSFNVLAQVGTELCGCQPATYTFTFDFGRTCADGTVAGPGINDTACLAEIRGQEEVPDSRLVPVSIESVQIFELDQNLQVVSQTLQSGAFVDGDTFTYTSIVSTDVLDQTSLPRGIQLVTTGLNEEEDSVVSTYIILYTNDCGIFPILTEGQAAGWTIFSDLGPPPIEVCPIARTSMPTAIPGTQTDAPTTNLSSDFPSLAPSVSSSPTQKNSTLAPVAVSTAPAAMVPVAIAPAATVPVAIAPVAIPPPVSSPSVRNSLPPICPPTLSKGKSSNSSSSGKGNSGKGGKSRSGSGSGSGKSKESGKSGTGTGDSRYSYDGTGKSGKGKSGGSDRFSGSSSRDGASTSLGNSKKDRYYGSSSPGVMQRVTGGSGSSLRQSDRRVLSIGYHDSSASPRASRDSDSYNIVEECIELSYDDASSSGKGSSQTGKGVAASLLHGKSGKGSGSGSANYGKSGKNGGSESVDSFGGKSGSIGGKSGKDGSSGSGITITGGKSGKDGSSGSEISSAGGKSGKGSLSSSASAGGKSGKQGGSSSYYGTADGSVSASVSASISASSSGSVSGGSSDRTSGKGKSSSESSKGKGTSGSSNSSSSGKGKGTTANSASISDSSNGKGKSQLSKRSRSSSRGMSKQSLSRSGSGSGSVRSSSSST